MSKVHVAVRVRPLNKREVKLGAQTCIIMKEKQTTLLPKDPSRPNDKRKFTYDHSFWSFDPKDENFDNQEVVFDALGRTVLENAFHGYNACIFAYGQTGSGKSYTMMGPEENKGLIPRLCDEIFKTIADNQEEHLQFKVEVEYMEIYNEKVRDLLGDVRGKKSLRVREHKIMGPYVEGLTKLAVSDFATINKLMEEGNAARTVAATNMNAESSRSHAVFTITVTQSQFDPISEQTGEKVSRVCLVDLAGSERAGKTGVTGDRLKEGSNINKSLTTLGLVISSLADISAGKKKNQAFVPYRDSVLTWLLKDSLGGNSKTIMVATISPATDNYEETLSTLRYADRAKRIVNNAVVNEDPSARLIRELREEVEALRSQLGVGAGKVTNAAELSELRDKLAESESLMQELSLSWEEKLSRAKKALEERQKQLEEMGISVQSAGIGVDTSKFYLVNLNADPSMSELLVYYLKDTETKIGSPSAKSQQDIVLSGLGIHEEHATVVIEDGEVYVCPLPNAPTRVNGKPITAKTLLRHGYRILWGSNHLFRVNCPRRADDTDDVNLDWNFAQRELDKSEEEWQKEKDAALEEQRTLYEKRIADLTATGTNVNDAMKEQARAEIERVLASTRENLTNMGRLIREGNDLCDDLHNGFAFKPTLRISEEGLADYNLASTSPEIAVVVNDHNIGQTSTISEADFNEHLEYLRTIYNSKHDEGENNEMMMRKDFRGGAELIGVAHCFLEKLSHGVDVELNPTIVGRDGKTAGNLIVGIRADPLNPKDSDPTELKVGDTLSMTVSIVKANHLRTKLTTPIYCSYQIEGHEQENVPQTANPNWSGETVGISQVTFNTDLDKKYAVEITPESLKRLTKNSLAIKVYGHNTHVTYEYDRDYQAPVEEAASESANTDNKEPKDLVAKMQQDTEKSAEELLVQHQEFARAWRANIATINLWAEICELDEQGLYSAVPTSPQKGILTGGIVQIRQGFARRIRLRLREEENDVNLGLTRVIKVRFGEVWMRTKVDPPASSNHEGELDYVKEKFQHKLHDKRHTLDAMIRELFEKEGKTDDEKARENVLIDEWMKLLAERAAMLQPARDSGLPGARTSLPCDAGYERESTFVYLPIDDDMTEDEEIDFEEHRWQETPDSFIELHIVSQGIDPLTGDLACEIAWDASAHDNPNLVRVTRDQNRIYMRLQVHVAVQQTERPLILNKLVCLKVFKRNHSFNTLSKRLFSNHDQEGCGMIYEAITRLPLCVNPAEVPEDQAREHATGAYFKGVESLESLLHIDKLRQELALQEGRFGTRKRSRSMVGRRSSPATPSRTSASDFIKKQKEEIVRKLEEAKVDGDTALVEKLTENLEQINRMDAAAGGSTGSQSGDGDESWILVDEDNLLDTPNVTIADADVDDELPSTLIEAVNHKGNLPGSPNLSPVKPVASPSRSLPESPHVSPNSSPRIRRKLPSTPDSSPSLARKSDLESKSADSEPVTAQAGVEPSTVITPVKNPKTSTEDLVAENAPVTTTEASSASDIAVSPSSTTTKVEEAAVPEPPVVTNPPPDQFKSSTTTAVATESKDEVNVKPLKDDSKKSSSGSTRKENPKPSAASPFTPGTTTNPSSSSTKKKPSLGNSTKKTGSTTKVGSVKSTSKSSSNNSSASSLSLSKKSGGSSGDITTKGAVVKGEIKEGSRVKTGGKLGYVRFLGNTMFSEGEWAGVELDDPQGKNDGCVDDQFYFTCAPKHGIFVRPKKLKLWDDSSTA